jgi:hypothetical protein
LDEHGILDKDCSWNIIVMNFEFLLVLNHDDVTLGLPIKGRFGEEERFDS